MHTSHTLRPVVAAIALLGLGSLPTAGLAQTAPAPAALETVVVTGIRQSLQAASEVKRKATQIVDAVSSEDVGKLPDANVAEALQRVTGVQVTRVFGEGQSVSIRGLPLVRVEVDGRTLLGYSARLSPPENEQLGRNSGLDTVPSGLFGRLEVRKSPKASQVEGGLSGSVNMVTPDPFDFRDFTVAARVAAEYADVTGKTHPAVSVLTALRSDDKNFGALVALDYAKRVSTTQAFERNNFFTRTRIGAGTAPGTSADLNGDGVADISGDRMQYEQFVVDRSRLGVTAEAQARLGSDLTAKVEAIYSTLKTERQQDFFSWRYSGRAITNPVFEGNVIVAGDSAGALQQAGLFRAEPTTSGLGALSVQWTPGDFTVRPELSFSRGTLEQTIRQITLDRAAVVPGRFDYRAGNVPSLDLGSFSVTDPANYKLATNGVRANLLEAQMQETVGKLDVDYDIDAGALKTLSFGLRHRQLEAKSNAYRSQVTATRDEVLPFWTTTDGSSFLPGVPGSFPRTFLTTIAARDFILQRATNGQPLLPNAARDYDLEEKATALYAMADFEGKLLDTRFLANVGVRTISTKFQVDTLTTVGATLAPVRDTSSYRNTLPSANIVFYVTPDFLIRAAAARTMQQAGIAELAPSLFVNTTNRTATSGNASLRPTLANNVDLSFEHYRGRTGLISGAIFYKDVSNVIADTTELRLFPAFASLGEIPYLRPANVGRAKVKGFELGVQTFFDFLPEPFNGLGLIANYTYSGGKGDGGIPLVGQSKNSFNLIALFEKGPFSARLAYNQRDKAAFAFTEGRPDYIDARSQLDFQMGYEIAKGLSVQFNAQNLSPKDSATVEFSDIGPVALNSYALSERRFSVGLRFKL